MIKFELTKTDKIFLLKLARKTIEIYLSTNSNYIPENIQSETLLLKAGAFVTLTNNSKLRGCIGRFVVQNPLFKIVQEMAIAAATKDSRFKPVQFKELGQIEIEISVLSPLKKIYSLDELEIGRDGIYIQKDYRTGTLLPQVATSNNWSKQEFIEYCSEYKAEIGRDGWKNADLYTYEAIVFEEKDFF